MRVGRARISIVLVLILGLILMMVIAAGVLAMPTTTTGPTYTVAQVVAGWHRQPADWIGHPLNLRGTIISYAQRSASTMPGGGPGLPVAVPISGGTMMQVPPRSGALVVLADNRQLSMPRLTLRVQVQVSSRTILRAALHSIPLVGPFMPSSLHIGTDATYQIQLNLPHPCGRLAGVLRCYDGDVLVS